MLRPGPSPWLSPSTSTAIPDRFNNGDMYAFSSSGVASGFPFVVNADFLLESSLKTLKFDSPWNIGILSYVPIVFATAFNLFLSHTASLGKDRNIIRDAYRYIPVEEPVNTELRKVQKRGLDLLRREYCVIEDNVLSYIPTSSALSVGTTQMFCKPETSRLIRQDFHNILIAAVTQSNPNLAMKNLHWNVVDRGLQNSYTPILEALGLPHVTEGEYIECLNEKDGILKLEGLHLAVVRFVWENCTSSTLSQVRTVPVFRYRKEDGLQSVQEYTTNGPMWYHPISERENEGCFSK